MKTILTMSAIALGLAVTVPALAQEKGAVPVTKAECQKVKGQWDETTQKCVMPK